MNKLLILLLSLLFVYKGEAQITFFKQYQRPSDYWSRGIYTARDGYFQLFSFHAQEMRLTKYDLYGNELWEKAYNLSAAQDFLNFTMQTQDHHFLLVGSSVGGAPNNLNGFSSEVLKLDTLGNVVWQHLYTSVPALSTNGNTFEYGEGITETNDGGYILASTCFGDNPTVVNTNIMLRKLDNQGNELWQKVYGDTLTDYLHKIVTTKQGDFILAGRSSIWPSCPQDSGQQLSVPLLMKVAANGDLLWEIALDTFGSTTQYCQNTYFDEVVALANGDFIASRNVDYDPPLLRFDTNGNAKQTVANIQASGIREYPDGTFYTINRGSPLWNHYDANFNLLWSKYFGLGDEYRINGMDFCRDGGFILSGSIIHGGGGSTEDSTFLMKMDCEGNIQNPVTCNPLSIENPRAVVFSLYPNPTQGLLHIRSTVLDGKIEIRDIEGKLLRTYEIQDTYDISCLDKGVYIVSILTKNQVLGREKLIVQ